MARRLEELRVRDLGVIDDVTVILGPGMTALTGETGAGKTLLVEAIHLLLGGKADPAVVRAGATEALVEGRFVDASGRPHGPRAEEDEDPASEVTLARAVAGTGRSKGWVDGRMATVGTLGETGGALIELHGQHQHRSLVHSSAQRAALDAFARIDPAVLETSRRQLHALADESLALGGDARQRARDGDLLRYQIDEIAAAAISSAGEDLLLEGEEDRLAAADEHRAAAAGALDFLAEAERGSALDALAEASGLLAGRAPLRPLEARVKAAMAEVSDLVGELRVVVETWEDDPARLAAVRARRQQLFELARKYGPSLGDVLEFAATATSDLAGLGEAEARAAALDARIAEARDQLAVVEAHVAASRSQAAPELASQIESTLHTLAMPSARFQIDVQGPGAADDVTFLLGANPGEPLLPLAKVASGGELARTMLAVRLAVGGSSGVLVFDEVDAGVGGEAADAVGAALAELGRSSQVLVVTHLAQVAARADHQLAVTKSQVDGRTVSRVHALADEERVVELSRMLSGSPESTVARAHARELLLRVSARPVEHFN